MLAELKVTKTKDGVLLTGAFPGELASSQSLELSFLKSGFYLLSIKGAIEQQGATQRGQANAGAHAHGGLPEQEKELIRKLLSIRFESRTPAAVSKTLSKSEKEILERLMQKKLVHVFHGGKYEKEGVYNVSDFAFNSVREPQSAAPLSSPPSSPQPARHSQPLSPSSPEHLESQGWMVLENDSDARNFGNSFPEKVKSGAVRGVRAFDRRFYFVTREFYDEWEEKVRSALSKSEKTGEEIAAELGMRPEGCRALLLHLCDSGEAMERHRGKFSKA